MSPKRRWAVNPVTRNRPSLARITSRVLQPILPVEPRIATFDGCLGMYGRRYNQSNQHDNRVIISRIFFPGNPLAASPLSALITVTSAHGPIFTIVRLPSNATRWSETLFGVKFNGWLDWALRIGTRLNHCVPKFHRSIRDNLRHQAGFGRCYAVYRPCVGCCGLVPEDNVTLSAPPTF